MKNTNYPDYVNNKKGMRKIINNKYIKCPECGEQATIKKNGKIFRGITGTGIGLSILSSGITFGSIITLGLAGIGTILSIMFAPMIITFAIIFLPIYTIIYCISGYTLECEHCKAKYKISNKEYNELRKKEIEDYNNKHKE